ncbi:hypothetical protein VSR01_10555 [Actinacidiphila sp. DG2A-62]|uniref:hypothetical protein n=1 Tax=Actinacidiphila sp. DG2A-62 TaxID=3108821 RepID=UPI002DBA0261|nr:hypothetical protein [Actinacidiphila sp. DG2A-62]MEC3993958.1 hypothetical protein [Actinacidiphila sp. DG2A-62]
MSAPLSPERLAEIRDRHAAAELGALYPAPEPFAAPGTIRATIGGVPLTVAVMDFRGWKAEENRQFVLRAHEDVRELLAEVERLTAQVDAVRAFATSHEYRWLHDLLDGVAVLDAQAEAEFAVEAGHAPGRVLPWLADLDPGDVQDLASALATATVGWQREPEIVLARVEWALEEIRARVADGGEPPVVAYRSPQSGALYCVPCHAGDIYTPVTPEDLPDGGLCAACDADVLITPAEAGESR